MYLFFTTHNDRISCVTKSNQQIIIFRKIDSINFLFMMFILRSMNGKVFFRSHKILLLYATTYQTSSQYRSKLFFFLTILLTYCCVPILLVSLISMGWVYKIVYAGCCARRPVAQHGFRSGSLLFTLLIRRTKFSFLSSQFNSLPHTHKTTLNLKRCKFHLSIPAAAAAAGRDPDVAVGVKLKRSRVIAVYKREEKRW